MKTFANYCLNQSKAAQKIAAEKHYSLTTGCDAWIELQKLDSEIRNNLVPELSARLIESIAAIKELRGIFVNLGYKEIEEIDSLIEELEMMPE